MIKVAKGVRGLKRGNYEMVQDKNKILFKTNKKVISVPIELLSKIKIESYEDNYAM